MLVELEQRAEAEPGAESGAEPVPVEELNLRRPDRKQFTYAAVDVEALIGPQRLSKRRFRLAWGAAPSCVSHLLESQSDANAETTWTAMRFQARRETYSMSAKRARHAEPSREICTGTLGHMSRNSVSSHGWLPGWKKCRRRPRLSRVAP